MSAGKQSRPSAVQAKSSLKKHPNSRSNTKTFNKAHISPSLIKHTHDLISSKKQLDTEQAWRQRSQLNISSALAHRSDLMNSTAPLNLGQVIGAGAN